MAVSGITSVIASGGVFNFSEFSISSSPGTDVHISVTTDGVDISKIE